MKTTQRTLFQRSTMIERICIISLLILLFTGCIQVDGGDPESQGAASQKMMATQAIPTAAATAKPTITMEATATIPANPLTQEDPALTKKLKNLQPITAENAANITFITSLKNEEKNFPGGSISVSPDSSLLVDAFYNQIDIWDLKTGQIQTSIKLDNTTLDDLVFSPDGKTFAGSSVNNTVEMWDVNKRARLWKTQVFSEYNQSFVNLNFSPDGTKLVAFLQLPMFFIIDAVTGEVIQQIEPTQYDIFNGLVAGNRAVAYSVYAANVPVQGVLSAYDFSTNQTEVLHITNDNCFARVHLVPSQDGGYIFGCVNKKLSTLEDVQAFQDTHGIAFSPDMQVMATLTLSDYNKKSEIQLFSGTDFTQLATLSLDVGAMKVLFSTDSTKMIVHTRDGNLLIYGVPQ